MEILQGVCKQHLRRRAVVGYGVKIFLPSPPNYVTRSPGSCPNLQYSPRERGFIVRCLSHLLEIESSWKVLENMDR